jgi:hypothetical protein
MRLIRIDILYRGFARHANHWRRALVARAADLLSAGRRSKPSGLGPQGTALYFASLRPLKHLTTDELQITDQRKSWFDSSTLWALRYCRFLST